MNGSSDELRFYREWTRMDANNFQSGVKSWTGDQGKHEELCLDRINRIGQDLFLGMETFGLGKESCRILLILSTTLWPWRYSLLLFQSARGLAHSRTLRDFRSRLKPARASWSAAALRRSFTYT